jgi:2-(1,2-epoxy-1,2-dihydrophenyl)acetyl-CoA isomerase
MVGRPMADIQTTQDGAVLTITLNRPDVLNALNASMHAALREALRGAEDPKVRAVVITGAGRGFCVGQDLQEFRAGAGDVADNLRANYHRNVLAIRALRKPVIAAVNGPAAGAGLSLALACDVRIASDAASFVPAFINIGLVPDSGGTWLVRRIIGTARAFEWLTTGRKLSAEEARAMGLVSEVVPAGGFEERMHEVGLYFASLPTLAVGETKRLLDAAETSTFEDQLEREAVTQAEMTRTDDFREGVAAFLAKREPVFTGAPRDVHPITLVNGDDLVRWRLTVFFRVLLVIPHLIVLTLWGIPVFVTVIAAWFVALVRGKVPDRMHDWIARYLRYSTHVNAYLFLVADPYPGFSGELGSYPVDLVIAPAARQARWKTLLRIVLAIPAYVFSYVLTQVAQLVAFIGWFVALATGRMPRGFRDLLAYALRFQMQTNGYLYLLTSRYPSLASGTVPEALAMPASSSGSADRT